jgi:hypothetical protein
LQTLELAGVDSLQTLELAGVVIFLELARAVIFQALKIEVAWDWQTVADRGIGVRKLPGSL